MTAPLSRVPERPRANRPKTDPDCPRPDAEPHDSVRAARGGCTCPDGVAALERDNARARRKNARRRQRRRETGDTRAVPSPVVAKPRKPAQPVDPAARARAAALRDQLLARDDLACLGHDPELFYPVGTGAVVNQQAAPARAVCGGCPALRDCLTVALATGDRWAVMGGTTPAERRRLRANAPETEAA